MKICHKCKRELPLTDFCKKSRDGYNTICKSCANIQHRLYRFLNPTVFKSYNRRESTKAKARIKYRILNLKSYSYLLAIKNRKIKTRIENNIKSKERNKLMSDNWINSHYPNIPKELYDLKRDLIKIHRLIKQTQL